MVVQRDKLNFHLAQTTRRCRGFFARNDKNISCVNGLTFQLNQGVIRRLFPKNQVTFLRKKGVHDHQYHLQTRWIQAALRWQPLRHLESTGDIQETDRVYMLPIVECSPASAGVAVDTCLIHRAG